METARADCCDDGAKMEQDPRWRYCPFCGRPFCGRAFAKASVALPSQCPVYDLDKYAEEMEGRIRWLLGLT